MKLKVGKYYMMLSEWGIHYCYILKYYIGETTGKPRDQYDITYVYFGKPIEAWNDYDGRTHTSKGWIFTEEYIDKYAIEITKREFYDKYILGEL